jgi:putative methyltransferase (TIGR04325 family)
MSATRAAVKSLCPPLLWQLGRSINLRFNPATPPPARYPVFTGPFETWTDAVAQSDGWDSPAITERTLRAALKVRDGIAEFEQDTRVLSKIRYSPTILTVLALALARNPARLDVIDFGGGLATNYFQNRKILEHLGDVAVRWTVVERPVFAELGRRHFEHDGLRFIADVDEAIELAAGNAFLFSGSLQYLAEPLALLDRVAATGATTIGFDRLLVSPAEQHRIYVQCPDPQLYYPATYPVWCFSKATFVDRLVAGGFRLVEDFTQQPAACFDHCGLVLVADTTS